MEEDLRWADPSREEVRTTCKLCLNYCGIIVSKTGDGIKLRGDPEHPLSKGFLCPKGLAALKVATHPARIRDPLKRIGARGPQKWRRVSWEEAIGEISSKLKGIIGRYGAGLGDIARDGQRRTLRPGVRNEVDPRLR